MKAIEYVIIQDDRVVVEDEVSRLSKLGWVPQGGVAFDKNGYACQAMIRTKTVKPAAKKVKK